MRLHVMRKQPNSKMCLVCGLKNDFGLHTAFYELSSGALLGVFRSRQEHQGYPGRLHGGLITALLDETIGRAVMIHQPDVWGVTVEVSTRFRKPVPLGQSLRALGRITKETARAFEGTGEILLADGSVAAEGFGRYLKQPLEAIADFDPHVQEWRVVPHPHDPQEVEL